MIRQSYWFVGIYLIMALSGRASDATTLDKLSECRSASTDNFSFRECVGLQHQASEVLLEEVEKSWLEYLAAQAAQESDANSVNNASPSTGSVAATQRPTAVEENTKQPQSIEQTVIAIVSDDTVSAADSQSQIINISGEALFESAVAGLASDQEIDVSPAVQLERFENLPALFRQYRNQLCAWESGLYSATRVDVYITACRAWQNEQRAQIIRSQLSEKRASDNNGTFFSGFYIEDDQGGIFQSCDRRREWRTSGNVEILAEMARRYDAVAPDNLEMAYLEVRGDYKQLNLPSGGFSGNLIVRNINLLRTIDEFDCSVTRRNSGRNSGFVAFDKAPNQNVGETTAPIDETDFADSPANQDITVDALGSAGFLYGYFSSWVSACAVDQLSVCMAQTDSEYSADGEWRLVVDRSLEGQWRVKLMPTISDTNIGRAIAINIDGIEINSRPVSTSDATVTSESGITLVQGDSAREMIYQMRGGQKLSLTWNTPTEIGNEILFSLLGITRAVDFFDQSG